MTGQPVDFGDLLALPVKVGQPGVQCPECGKFMRAAYWKVVHYPDHDYWPVGICKTHGRQG